MGNSVSVSFPAFIKKTALPVTHLMAGILNFYALWYDQKYVNVKFSESLEGYPFKSRVLFLTMWNLVLQTIYMYVAFLNDIVGTNEPSPTKTPTIRYVKDTLFSIAYPSAMYVSSAFWTIYFLNKDLVFPKRFQEAYPNWLNHVMHTLVSVFINIEMFSSNITYPSDKVNSMLGLSLMFSYTTWLFIVYFQTGTWIYPVLGYFNWPTRILLVLISLTIAHYINVFGKELNKRLSANFKGK